MYRVGRQMPRELRETGLGGIAATPTGIAIKNKNLWGETIKSISYRIYCEVFNNLYSIVRLRMSVYWGVINKIYYYIIKIFYKW